MKKKEGKKWLYWFSFVVACIFVYKFFDNLSGIFSTIGNFFNVIMPFFLAAILAYILYIPSKKIEDKIRNCKFNFISKHARGLSVSIIYIILILIVFLFFNFLIPNVKESVVELVSNSPNYFNNFKEYISNQEENTILGKFNTNIIEYLNNIEKEDMLEKAVAWFSLDNVGSYIKGIVGATRVVFNIFVCVIVSLYILIERNDIKSFSKNLTRAIFNNDNYKVVVKYFAKTNSIFYKYISAQVIDAFVIGIITTIAMLIMKIKYAVLLGFMIGLFNLIPYFGAIFAVALAIIITAFTGGPINALWLALVIIILQQIDANIINPKILGSSLKISKILVIMGVTIGGSYFGVLGMFLGVPVLAFCKEVIVDLINYSIKKKEEEIKE